jgi:uncharacterized iron-regulated membrane protein
VRPVSVRSLVFWPHLVAGVLAGAVILIMSVTGVLLTYEKQMIAWSDSRVALSPDAPSPRLPAGVLVERIREATGAPPATLAISSEGDRPIVASVSQKMLLVDPRSGAILGESAPALRRFFRQVTDWHRWLALAGEQRIAGRAVTGWSNVVFLFLVLSGMYLWLPRVWSWRHVRSVAWFGRGLSGRARDFNWHHVIGIWSAVPLALVVASAMPISFPWANALVYRLVGETPPAAAPRAGAAPRSATGGLSADDLRALDDAWGAAQQQVGDWRSITVRVPPAGGAPFVFTIDRGAAGQPQYRGTLTIARDGSEPRWESFASQTTGRRVRSISRFLHTGEVLGVPGQTIAGLATLGGVVLVWTGVALALRRAFAARRRRVRQQPPAASRAA